MELAEDFPSLELQERKAKLLMEADITRSSSQRSLQYHEQQSTILSPNTFTLTTLPPQHI